ncbi:hydrolase [Streptomyces sp. NPDC048383]|uniref:hydrolase n=1 Tax=Streptomyces sp. NPDC048383 TaxID=3155386 RepID=UPI003432A448
MDPRLDSLPDAFWTVPYTGSRYPGSPAVSRLPGLAPGANCQLFAYEVLRHFGRCVPPLRSSELWNDTRHTARVARPDFLDLLFFNADTDPYGAHVGVWAGPDAVLHLSSEVGRPAVWSLADFTGHDRYRVLLGAKRAGPCGAGTPLDLIGK